jgi:hypothetical protein
MADAYIVFDKLQSYKLLHQAGFTGWWSDDSFSTDYMKTFTEITGIADTDAKILTPGEVEYIYLSCINRQPSDTWRTNDSHRLKEWLRICKSGGGKIALLGDSCGTAFGVPCDVVAPP